MPTHLSKKAYMDPRRDLYCHFIQKFVKLKYNSTANKFVTVKGGLRIMHHSQERVIT